MQVFSSANTPDKAIDIVDECGFSYVNPDGAFYTKEDGSLIWNISYEYTNPTLKMTKDYILLYPLLNLNLQSYIFLMLQER